MWNARCHLCRGCDSGTVRAVAARCVTRRDAMPTVLAMLMLFLAALAAPTASVRAQSSDVGSFLNAFPEGDRYKVQVWGDAMSEGLLDGLSDLLVEETRFQLDKKHRWLGGLMKADAEQDARTIDAAMAAGAPDIVVVMLGAADRVSLRRPNGRRSASSASRQSPRRSRFATPSIPKRPITKSPSAFSTFSNGARSSPTTRSA